MLDAITYPFPNFNGYTVDILELMSNCITHFAMEAITYSCEVGERENPLITEIYYQLSFDSVTAFFKQNTLW